VAWRAAQVEPSQFLQALAFLLNNANQDAAHGNNGRRA
jgi:hypothetical protein